jgi:hypothetical protein
MWFFRRLAAVAVIEHTLPRMVALATFDET